ncbi:hypothetical protein AWRI1631_141310 [Saccharomyces cerevisiae AWRI1631]|uniref:Uncharacterized protein n=1 Tax=Saccharomyces cerevisiae (strain AWRI1631) TaxID=545124 RepID=B5VQK9_YEAS6|nr:hypothetical protein AWRI1631_141310 [Saccharomyces cerevisiae AWRI1631]
MIKPSFLFLTHHLFFFYLSFFFSFGVSSEEETKERRPILSKGQLQSRYN